MPCNTDDLSINPPALPPFQIPGIGRAISPIPLPIPDWNFPPPNFPDLLTDWLDKLRTLWPGADKLPFMDDVQGGILKAISFLIAVIEPFLSFWNFSLPIPNMILCIIDVLCAIPNPFAVAKALIRLFKQCLPQLLSIFPWIALALMLIGLLLLLLAIIEYIITTLLAIIQDILENIALLAQASILLDPEAAASAIAKIGQLFCLLDNLFAIFAALASVFAILKALGAVGGSFTCFGGSSDCCTDDVCPPFIKNQPDGFNGVQGTLRFNTENQTTPTRYQFYSTDGEYPFKAIITPLPGSDGKVGGVFWPGTQTFNLESTEREIPYVVNLKINNYDPQSTFNNDTKGPRTFIIKNVIVSSRPYVGVYNSNNELDKSINDLGTLQLLGGIVFEVVNGSEVIYKPNGSQLTLQDFLGTTSKTINNIEYIVQINQDVLAFYSLITIGCLPDFISEAAAINSQFAEISALGTRVDPLLPNIAAAQTCANEAIGKARTNLTLETAVELREALLGCLSSLQGDTEDILCKLIPEAVSIYNSTFEIDPDIQFVTRPIKVYVTLRDPNGVELDTIPEACQGQIGNLITTSQTLGTVGKFTYNGSIFQADLTSDVAGTGKIKVSFDANVLKTVINRDDNNLPTSFVDQELEYEFIDVLSDDSGIRRDDTDANNG